jgi:hypothetical protein
MRLGRDEDVCSREPRAASREPRAASREPRAAWAPSWADELAARRARLQCANEPWLQELLQRLVDAAERGLARTDGQMTRQRHLSREEVLAQASPAVREKNPHLFGTAPAIIQTPSGQSSVVVEPAGPAMNKTELRYEQRLRAFGLEPRFGALTICITSGRRRRRYTPDFAVVVDGALELHEVKGGYIREDAQLKFDVAVEQWGDIYTFVLAQWSRGTWTERRFPRRTTARRQRRG